MFFVMEAFFMMVVNSNLKVKVDQSAAKTSKEIVEEYTSRKAEGTYVRQSCSFPCCKMTWQTRGVVATDE